MKAREGLGKVASGAVIGVALSFLYIQFGYKPPAAARLLDIPKEVTALALDVVADSVLYDAASSLEDQQRAIAFKIGSDHEFFREIDSAIGNRFTNEALRRRAARQASELRIRHTAFDRIFNYPALRKHYEARYGTTDQEALKRAMLSDAIQEQPFLHQYLQKQFPDQSDEELAARILETPSLPAP